MAQEPKKLRVNVFAGVQNLPIFAGQAKGIFARRGFDIELQFTPNSACAARGADQRAPSRSRTRASTTRWPWRDTGAASIIVMGGDSSMQELFAQPDVKSIADLKGRTVIVDAPNTAYALVVKKALLNEGLRDGQDYTVKATGGTFVRLGLMKENKEHAASMLNPPFSITCGARGLSRVSAWR